MSNWNSGWWNSKDDQSGWKDRGWRSNSSQHQGRDYGHQYQSRAQSEGASGAWRQVPPPKGLDPEDGREERRRWPRRPDRQWQFLPDLPEPHGQQEGEHASRQSSRLVLTPGPGAKGDGKGARADGDGGDALRESIAIGEETNKRATGSGGGDALRESTSPGAAS